MVYEFIRIILNVLAAYVDHANIDDDLMGVLILSANIANDIEAGLANFNHFVY